MSVGDKIRALQRELNLPPHWIYWIKDGDNIVIKIWDTGKKNWIIYGHHY